MLIWQIGVSCIPFFLSKNLKYQISHAFFSPLLDNNIITQFFPPCLVEGKLREKGKKKEKKKKERMGFWDLNAIQNLSQIFIIILNCT